MTDRPKPEDQARRLYEDAEARTASALEELVKRDSFGEILARVAENTFAVAKISNDMADFVVRNLRLAGRRDLTSLGRQLARTEDKLEMLLQEVERLQLQLERERGGEGDGGEAERNGAAPRTGRPAAREEGEEPSAAS